MRRLALGLTTGTALALSGAAMAQQVPARIDPGAIQQQTLETQGQASAPLSVPGSETDGLVRPEVPPPLVFPAGGPTFRLKAVEFGSSSLLPQADLDAIAARYVGRDVDLSQVQSIANEVNALYADRGYVTASAILPAQDLSSGRLQVQLVEGRTGNVSYEGRRTLRESYLAGVVRLPPDSVVDAPALTRQVDRFNRTNAAQIQASLAPGAGFGLTDINLAVIEPPRNTLQVFADNLGVETVGEYEGGLLYQNYGLLGLDDRLTAYGLYAEGNLFGNASYNLAVTPWGTRVGVSYSRSAIRIVDGPFVDLDVDGESEVVSANLSHPLYSAGPYLLLGNLATSYSQSQTNQSGVRITDDETVKGTAGFSASYLGQIFSLTLSPTLSLARADINITGEELEYELFQISGSGSVRLDEETLLVARGTGQYASARLLPGSDLFQIGGPASVRGYPSSAASGDSGYFYNLELHRSLGRFVEGLEGFVFIDNGTVFSEFPASLSLTSFGAGLNYSWNDRLRAEVSLGIPIEDAVADQSDLSIYARLVATVF
ncbi:ShlB/FhaC/HecB family hemolysin secretion/activation protein [Fulvimarina endophytica]|nr:POTRA domain-containing protein [Fulvimarina endophytica]